jgi:tetratricopeptide (TPR) repeat protein
MSQSADSFISAEGYFGLGDSDDANEQFRAAVKQQPKSAEVRAEWGRLYLEHWQSGDAAKLFEEALEVDPNYAPAYLGLARVKAEQYDPKAVDLANEALKRDPKLFEAHELLASMALEDSNAALAAKEAQAALAISPEALRALSVLASIDWLNGKEDTPWIDKIQSIDPRYGEAYATGAHFFEINRRYEECIRFDHKALELNPELWDAREQLGVNLLRQGDVPGAKQELERCYAAHWRDPRTVNSLRLIDRAGDYITFKSGTTTLVLSKKEAELLRPYIGPELQRAVATYEKKYKMKLPGPVRLEVYPNHEDFIVRTLGLPGQGGLLGVTFGLVVAMDSPSARAPGEFNWASTMWHELSHVYVLTATHHLVPRWFTEGLAVHEEGAVSPEWGDRLTPEIIAALQKKQLLPVVELDRGFVRPQYATQVVVSYYEAGKMCDYIAGKWGDAAILGMIRSYSERKSTAETIQENLHETPAAFDKQFLAWLDSKTGETVRHFDEWKRGVKAASASLAQGDREAAIQKGTAVRDYYSDYVGSDSDYELIAQAYAGKNDKKAAMQELERYRDAGGSNVGALRELAQLEVENGHPKDASATLTELSFIYPEDIESHRIYGKLLLTIGDSAQAVREDKAVLALDPSDAADAHYQLAAALQSAHRRVEAKDEVILALEAAPDFKPAQQLLLQLSQ